LAQPKQPSPTVGGRQTQAALDAAARTVIERKGILVTIVSDMAADARWSTALKSVTRRGLSNYERAREAA
jgi:hypothetical protein